MKPRRRFSLIDTFYSTQVLEHQYLYKVKDAKFQMSSFHLLGMYHNFKKYPRHIVSALGEKYDFDVSKFKQGSYAHERLLNLKIISLHACLDKSWISGKFVEVMEVIFWSKSLVLFENWKHLLVMENSNFIMEKLWKSLRIPLPNFCANPVKLVSWLLCKTARYIHSNSIAA